MYLKILCLQKETVQLLMPHQENLARGPKFELSEWLLLKELPAKFDAVRTFVHNSCLKNHTLTRDWYLTMSIFVTDDNSVTKRGNLYKHIPPGEDLFELLFLGGILNIFQTVFYDEWRGRRGYGDTKPVSCVLFDWANVDPSEIHIAEKSAVEKTFELARRLEEDESYKGCKFGDGFFPTGRKGGKNVGWTEVCRQVAKKTDAAAAAIKATEGPVDNLGDLDELVMDEELCGVDELVLGEDLGDDDVCDCNGIGDLYLQPREDDSLEGLPFQPVVDDGDCGSLDEDLSQDKLSHSFHMIGRDGDSSQQYGGVMNEFVDHLGAHEKSEPSLKQRFDALKRENELLKQRNDMLEQKNQSLMHDQVWLGGKPLHRRRYQTPTRPRHVPRLLGLFGSRAVTADGKLWFQDNGEWGFYVGDPLDSNDHRQGNGVMTYVSGSIYEGGFVGNKYHSERAIHRCGGDCFEGPYFDGRRNGKVCIYRYADGCIEYGSWFEGLPSGVGVMWSTDRKNAYQVINGELEGAITLAVAEKIAKETFNLAVPQM